MVYTSFRIGDTNLGHLVSVTFAGPSALKSLSFLLFSDKCFGAGFYKTHKQTESGDYCNYQHSYYQLTPGF